MARPARAAAVPDGAPPLLGVACSFTGRRWQLRLPDERAAYALAQRAGIGEFAARVLAGRGIDAEAAPRAISARLRDNLCDPSDLCDMDRAAERLAEAVEGGEPIALFGDYDVDGATSAALLYRCLAALGCPPLIHVPDRLTEGYGPNIPALEGLARRGIRVVVTVDCGTQAEAPLRAAAALGLDVIVLDHHQAGPALPACHALVNPNRLDDRSGQGMLAAVGVAFLCAVALLRTLRARGYFARTGRTPPDLRQFLDLVALGTVCDVVPLTGLNRAFVAQGLKVLAETASPGLLALMAAAGLDERPGAYHLGFLLGPRVNAGGRIGEAGLGARLLTTDEPEEARALALRLDRLNRERQVIEAAVLEAAVAEVEARGEPGGGPLIVAGEGWHPGVVGIVASRLKERYGRPALVIGIDETGLGRGSGRSIPGVDLGRAVRHAVDAGLLVSGGGHAMAAGLALRREALAAAEAHLTRCLEAEIAAALARPTLALDGFWSGLDPTALLAEIAALEPFGAGFPEPLLALAAARLAYVDRVGDSHLAVTLEPQPGQRLRAMAFRAADSDLGRALIAARGGFLHVAGRLKRGYRGRGGELHLEDAAPAG